MVKKPGRKILSYLAVGAATLNLYIGPGAIRATTYFCKSALARFTQWGFH